MRHLQRAVGESEARNRLRGKGLGSRLRRFFSRNTAEHLESIWLPVYLVTIGFAESAGPKRVTCSVEGLRGSFAIFELHAAIADGEPSGEKIAPALDAASAERIAREGLVTTLLRRSGQARRTVPGGTESVEQLLWPYWVLYYRRANGRLDLRLLDAVTGSTAGHKIKLGLLEAFRAAAPIDSKVEGD